MTPLFHPLCNVQVENCGSDCIAVNTVSSLNVRGCLVSSSGGDMAGEHDVNIRQLFLFSRQETLPGRAVIGRQEQGDCVEKVKLSFGLIT